MRQVSPCIVGALLLMLALSAVPRQAVAQITSGSVTGSIRDGQGGVIPGASVTLISAARGTSLEVTSNSTAISPFRSSGRRPTCSASGWRDSRR